MAQISKRQEYKQCVDRLGDKFTFCLGSLLAASGGGEKWSEWGKKMLLQLNSRFVVILKKIFGSICLLPGRVLNTKGKGDVLLMWACWRDIIYFETRFCEIRKYTGSKFSITTATCFENHKNLSEVIFSHLLYKSNKLRTGCIYANLLGINLGNGFLLCQSSPQVLHKIPAFLVRSI